VLAFSARAEYFVNCQGTPSAAAVVGDACDEVVNTFEVQDAGRLAAPAGRPASRMPRLIS
jgi:hypothetical protein